MHTPSSSKSTGHMSHEQLQSGYCIVTPDQAKTSTNLDRSPHFSNRLNLCVGRRLYLYVLASCKSCVSPATELGCVGTCTNTNNGNARPPLRLCCEGSWSDKAPRLHKPLLVLWSGARQSLRILSLRTNCAAAQNSAAKQTKQVAMEDLRIECVT